MRMRRHSQLLHWAILLLLLLAAVGGAPVQANIVQSTGGKEEGDGADHGGASSQLSAEAEACAEAERLVTTQAVASVLPMASLGLGGLGGLGGGGGGGEVGRGGWVSTLARATQLCPSNFDLAMRYATTLLQREGSNNGASAAAATIELRRALTLVTVGAPAVDSGTIAQRITAWLQLWDQLAVRRIDGSCHGQASLDACSAGQSSPIAAASVAPSAASSSSQKSLVLSEPNTVSPSLNAAIAASSEAFGDGVLLPLPPPAGESADGQPGGASSEDDDGRAPPPLPSRLRLLWPTPFFNLRAELEHADRQRVVEAVQRMRRRSQVDDHNHNRTRLGPVKQGFSTRDDLFAATPSATSPLIRNACSTAATGDDDEADIALVRFCTWLGLHVRTLFEQQPPFYPQITHSNVPRSSQGHSRRRGPPLDLELLSGQLHSDEWMEAPAQSHLGEDVLAALLNSSAPPLPSASSSSASECRRWDRPQLYSVYYTIARGSISNEADARGLAVDDELSFRDPRPQASPLLPHGGFFAASEPMRFRLNEGELIVAPAWLARTLAPNTARMPRVICQWTIAVRELSCLTAAVGTATSVRHEKPLPSSRVRLPPALVYRWPTAVYRSTILSSGDEIAALNSVLASHILSLRTHDRSHRRDSTVKSNRGGWHSNDLQLLGRPELDVAALQAANRANESGEPSGAAELVALRALRRLRRLIVAHVHAYVRAVAAASCHSLFLNPAAPDCRPAQFRKLEGKLNGRNGGAASDLEERIRIQHSWSVANAAGHFNMPHNHPGALFSGAYYVATGSATVTDGAAAGSSDSPGRRPSSSSSSSSAASAIQFLPSGHPLALLHGGAAVPRRWTEPFAAQLEEGDADDEQSGLGVSEQLEAGKLLLFPAWLEHAVSPHWPTDSKAPTPQEDERAAEENESRVRIVISFNVMFLDDE